MYAAFCRQRSNTLHILPLCLAAVYQEQGTFYEGVEQHMYLYIYMNIHVIYIIYKTYIYETEMFGPLTTRRSRKRGTLVFSAAERRGNTSEDFDLFSKATASIRPRLHCLVFTKFARQREAYTRLNFASHNSRRCGRTVVDRIRHT